VCSRKGNIDTEKFASAAISHMIDVIASNFNATVRVVSGDEERRVGGSWWSETSGSDILSSLVRKVGRIGLAAK